MRRTVLMLISTAALSGAAACMVQAATDAGATNTSHDITLPAGYRDWTLISVAREEGGIDDLRAVLGNEAAIEALRNSRYPLPDGAVIARLAWSYDELGESAQAFGQSQSHVAGHPKNGVQFMVKDPTNYASTGGWGYAQFDPGKSYNTADQHACFACHSVVKDRDFVFNRFAPDLPTGMRP